MEVVFRKASLEDVEGIIALCNECFNENTSIDYAKKIFAQTENDPNQIYIIGKIDDAIVAHAKITIIPTMYQEMNTYAILNHVCVKEEWRRHNIATAMLDEVTKICKDMECKTIELWSKNFRIPAHSCYKQYGFQVEDAAFFALKI